MLGIVAAHIFIIQGVPRISCRQITPLRPPMAPVLADHGKQSVANLVQHENTRLLHGVLLIATMKHQDFWKRAQQVLLHAPDFLTLFAGPRGILVGMHSGRNRIRNALAFGGRQRKLQHTLANQVGLIALQTGNACTKLKPQELVQPRNLVAQRHQKFVTVSDVFPCGQILSTNGLVEFSKARSLRIEDLLQSLIHIGVFRFQSFLAFTNSWNSKESLEGRIDPTGSFHVSQAEHLTLTRRTC